MPLNNWQNDCLRLIVLALVLAVLFSIAPQRASAGAANTNSVAPPKAKVAQRGTTGDSAKPKPRPTARQLSGAELYSMHCNRCHPERYPTERTAAQWKTIMLHMRVRANLPGQEAKTILKYLQDNSGR